MFFMTALHHLAAQRGDGLRKDLLERLAGVQAPLTGSNVIAMGMHDGEGIAQAGPNPRGGLQTGERRGNVVPFEKFRNNFKV